MLSYPLYDRETKDIVAHIATNNHAKIFYSHYEGALDAFLHFMKNKIKENKQFSILLSEDMDAAHIKTMLKEQGLDQYFIDVEDTLSEIREKLLHINDKKVLPVDLSKLLASAKSFEMATDHQQKIFNKINKVIFEKSSWKNLCDYRALANNITPIDFNIDKSSFQWNFEEFNGILTAIKKSQIGFQFSFTHLSTLDPFTDQFYSSIEDESNFDQQIDAMRTEVSELNSFYQRSIEIEEQCKWHLKSTRKKTINQVYQIVQDLGLIDFKLNLIEQDQTQKSKQTILEIKFKEKNTLAEEKENLHQERNSLIQEIKQYISVDHEQNTNFDLPFWLNIIETENFEFIQNKKEQKLDLLKESKELLLNEVNTFLEQTESAKLISANGNIVLDDIDQTSQELHKLISNLNQAIHFALHNPEFIFWKKNQLEHSKLEIDILNGLLQVDIEEWHDCFESWYINSLLEHNKLQIDVQSTSSGYDEYIALQDIQEQYFAFQLAAKRSVMLRNLKEDDRLLFRILFLNHHVQDFPVKRVSLSFLSKFFPIVLIRDSHLKDLQETDHFITIELKNDELKYPRATKHIDLLSVQSKRGSVQGRALLDMSRRPLLHYSKEHTSKVNDKLRFGKNLAYQILNLTKRIRVFETKEATIISCWSKFKNEIMIQHLAHKQPKEFTENDLIENQLLEGLVREKDNVFILLEDGLFNSKLQHDMLWQHHLKEKLSQFGIQFINIWTDQYFEVGKTHLESVLNEHFPIKITQTSLADITEEKEEVVNIN